MALGLRLTSVRGDRREELKAYNISLMILFRERLAAGERAAGAAEEAYSCQLSQLHQQLTGLHGIRWVYSCHQLSDFCSIWKVCPIHHSNWPVFFISGKSTLHFTAEKKTKKPQLVVSVVFGGSEAVLPTTLAD
jgi:hypothetical protein